MGCSLFRVWQKWFGKGEAFALGAKHLHSVSRRSQKLCSKCFALTIGRPLCV
jgi:hypothetical protein